VAWFKKKSFRESASFVKRKCSKREPPKQVQIGRALALSR